MTQDYDNDNIIFYNCVSGCIVKRRVKS